MPDTQKILQKLNEKIGIESRIIMPHIEEKPERAYSKKKLLIGWRRKIKWNGASLGTYGYWEDHKTIMPFFLDASESTRTLIVGSTGAGKTWLLERHYSENYKNGNMVVALTDTKGDMEAAAIPNIKNSEVLRSLDEYPQAVPTQMLYPSFLGEDL